MSKKEGIDGTKSIKAGTVSKRSNKSGALLKTANGKSSKEAEYMNVKVASKSVYSLSSKESAAGDPNRVNFPKMLNVKVVRGGKEVFDEKAADLHMESALKDKTEYGASNYSSSKTDSESKLGVDKTKNPKTSSTLKRNKRLFLVIMILGVALFFILAFCLILVFTGAFGPSEKPPSTTSTSTASSATPTPEIPTSTSLLSSTIQVGTSSLNDSTPSASTVREIANATTFVRTSVDQVITNITSSVKTEPKTPTTTATSVPTTFTTTTTTTTTTKSSTNILTTSTATISNNTTK